MFEWISFLLPAILAIASAIAVIACASRKSAAIWLLAFIASTSTIIFLLAAPIIASIHLLIGGLSSLALAELPEKDASSQVRGKRDRSVYFSSTLVIFAASYLVFILAIAILRSPSIEPPSVGTSFISYRAILESMFGKFPSAYLFAGMLWVATLFAILFSKSERCKS